MTPPDVPRSETTSEPEALREELRRAEVRLTMLRAANAALEQRLLKSSGLRRTGLATVAAALLVGMFAHAVGGRLGAAQAAHERALAVEAHRLRVADRSVIVDACRASVARISGATDRCKSERDELRQRLRDRVTTRPDKAPPCNCQPGDPLCSCF
jgi:hypothetical protein